MRYLLLALVLVGLTALEMGCTRCTGGTEEVNGVCLDRRPPQDARVAAPDAEPPPTVDAGSVDAGSVDAGRADAGRADATIVGGRPGQLLLRGAAVLPMTADGVVYAPGEVYVRDERIQCVGARGACAAMAQEATVIDTGDVILPGFIDAHTHTAFNWLPEWTPGRLWNDHTHWQSSRAYDEFIDPQSSNKTDAEKFCAMVHWGEMRSLFNGVTTMFGTPQPRTCFRWLVRNAELSTGYNGWSRDRMRSNTLGIGTVDTDDATRIAAEMDSGETTAYMIHMAEGLSSRARGEFTRLQELGLLRAQTVIIHGTAMTEADFAAAGTAGAKLIWSPSSNMVLYGDTTNVKAAVDAGLSVSIAPDWTPSGSDDVLHELRFARQIANERWPGLFSDQQLLEMITRIPAEQMSISADVGTLEPGKYADIVVISVAGAADHTAIIDSQPQDLQLVLIGGKPVYGDLDRLLDLDDAPGPCRVQKVCGADKATCWGPTPSGDVTVEATQRAITGFFPAGPQPLVECD